MGRTVMLTVQDLIELAVVAKQMPATLPLWVFFFNHSTYKIKVKHYRACL